MKKKLDRWFVPAMAIFIAYIIGLGIITGKLEWFLIAIAIEFVIGIGVVAAIKLHDRRIRE